MFELFSFFFRTAGMASVWHLTMAVSCLATPYMIFCPGRQTGWSVVKWNVINVDWISNNWMKYYKTDGLTHDAQLDDITGTVAFGVDGRARITSRMSSRDSSNDQTLFDDNDTCRSVFLDCLALLTQSRCQSGFVILFIYLSIDAATDDDNFSVGLLVVCCLFWFGSSLAAMKF